jgi:hypothetical protein
MSLYIAFGDYKYLACRIGSPDSTVVFLSTTRVASPILPAGRELGGVRHGGGL